MMMSGDDVGTRPIVRRLEVFTGAGTRRRWTADDKARIVAESYETGSVSQTARRYGLAANQLFTWRRVARRQAMPAFVPVMIADRAEPLPVARPSQAGGIMLEIAGVPVAIGRDAEAHAIEAVIRTLHALR